MNGEQSEYGLEFLLAFDGRIHHLEEGYWIKFEIKRVKAAKERPHGLSYSFTLHRTARGWSVSITPMAFRRRARGSNGRRIRTTIGIERRTIQGDPISSRMPRP